MNRVRFCQQIIRFWAVLFLLFVLDSNRAQAVQVQGEYDPTSQSPTLLYNEARTVYLGNLARRANGIPPLRWNAQLTYAARWFSWDSTENRPAGFCGHQDSQGHWPDYRTSVFGYLGSAGAENSFCGYVSPENAIQGWMNSPGHRANLLDPNSREIGVGYYRRSSDGRGYVTQDFGNDTIYAPVIIENEAVSTTNPAVNLYIYDRATGGGFAGLSAATEMMVSNNAHFSGASWEPYSANKPWTLASLPGWRTVFVKTRDVFTRTLTASDTIYLGAEADVPRNELGEAQMSTTQSQVTLLNLNGGTLPQVQFSLGWLADDTFESFHKWWGNGEPVDDPAAWGGTAYRLFPGDGESFAWVNDWTFIKDTPLVAYFRLKVNDNSSSSEVARISINGGGTEYGPLSLRGTDFTASDQYQEFAISFTFNTNPNDAFLTFNFWRSGNADVYIDAVSIFSAPQAITSPLTWSVPGGNYRGQGVWVRYTDGSQFSDISEVDQTPYTISGNTGVAGATLSYNDGTGKTVVADENGNYSITVPYGWSGTVTPSHPCFIFTPESWPYTNLVDDALNQDYTPNAGTCVSAITRAHNNPTDLASVDFTVTFTKSVTGVDIGDFVLSTNGVSGAEISKVTGSDATYTVSVNTGAGTGTIRLDVVDNDSIKDASNHLLGGPGNGNGNFNSGETYTLAILVSKPVLLFPAKNNYTTNDSMLAFTWSESDNAHHYEIVFATDTAFSHHVGPFTITDPSFSFGTPLADGRYYWRVQAYDARNSPGGWSVSHSFIIDTLSPLPPAPRFPANNTSTRGAPTFRWFTVNGAVQYQFEIDNESNFSSPMLSVIQRLTYRRPPGMLRGAYYWHVRAQDAAGNWSDWSPTLIVNILPLR
ncbi:MAG TPA: CAP domain-containing protein [Anaerolineales bacterium]|nr:CAP domain-containing protein [Anaerolineales bacterium]